MSLQEVYRLAHTAECRLNISASRPDRNLRYVVGHLMHYESLRLRIVEIEHVISRSERASAIKFQGTGDAEHQQLRHKTSTGQLGKRSPPPPYSEEDDDFEEDEGLENEPDDAEGGLGLTRFPSGASRPPPLVPDNEDDDDDLAEPTSPEEPDSATVEQALKRPADSELAQELERVRRCPCHGQSEAPHIENVWQLPTSEQDKTGFTRAVAQVAG